MKKNVQKTSNDEIRASIYFILEKVAETFRRVILRLEKGEE